MILFENIDTTDIHTFIYDNDIKLVSFTTYMSNIVIIKKYHCKKNVYFLILFITKKGPIGSGKKINIVINCFIRKSIQLGSDQVNFKNIFSYNFLIKRNSRPRICPSWNCVWVGVKKLKKNN